MAFGVKFWGVRGSIAVSSPEHVKYGGNTSCVELNLDGRRIVVDAGTGLRFLGNELMRQDVREVDVLLSHTHWDHISGFPFFVPAYVPNRSVRVISGHLRHREGIQRVLSYQMADPVFPVPMEVMQAHLRFDDYEPGDAFRLHPDVEVKTAPLNHPNDATAYRIEYHGKSVCYVSDTEHVPGETDHNVLGLIEGADLVIYDATYTEDEFPEKVGWGHSTWNEGIRLCRMANVKQMAIFHHEPNHDDAFMERLEAAARAVWSDVFAARDFMELTLD